MSTDSSRAFRGLQAGPEPLDPLRWRPAVDIYRTGDGWLLKAELAGVRPEDLRVDRRGSLVIIGGRRCDHTLVKGIECYALEIEYSHFERTIKLPENLDNARIEAGFQQGMLLVHLITTG